MHMKSQLEHTDENQRLNLSRSYILRLWRADELQLAEWHASLEDPSTRNRFGFSNLEQMFAFLMEQCESESSMSAGISGKGNGGG